MEQKRKQIYSGIGGQAIMEGIMMRNKDRYAAAVRKPDGEIDVMEEERVSFSDKHPFAGQSGTIGKFHNHTGLLRTEFFTRENRPNHK